MPGITAIATLLTIYAAGEIIARKTFARWHWQCVILRNSKSGVDRTEEIAYY